MEVSQELADRVLDLVSGPGFRPSKPRQIADALGIDKEAFRELKRVIKALVLQGRLKYGPNHLVLGIISPSEGDSRTSSSEKVIASATPRM